MRTKTLVVLSVVLIVSVALSGCSNLLPQDETPLMGDYGSPYTPEEHQLRTFEALWTNLQENYIYFDTAKIDWDGLHTQYTDQIKGGLNNEQFTDLLHNLQNDLPAGTLAYTSRAERIQAETTDNSSYSGIGAYVGFQAKPEPHIVILGVMDGSPAEQAGIRAHDSLIMIDGSPILLEEGITATQRIRGPAGTSVKLTVRSPGNAERVVEVTRAQVASSGNLTAREVPGKPYGYILFPPFAYDGIMDDFRISMQGFTANKTLDGLILDLRVTNDGRGWPLQELFTIFHDGEIGEFYDRTNTQTARINGQDLFGSQSVPLIILVGQNTSGSPEIFAASLQAYGRATLVGETTPGSIESTTTYNLPDGSLAFIETTSFRLSNGSDVGNNGVKPDIQVEAGWEDILPNNDPVLEKAIELLEAQP
ncbi:MAG: S41 family peptidase [Anaerolineales bacterium]